MDRESYTSICKQPKGKMSKEEVEVQPHRKFQNSYIIYEAQCRMKIWSPLFKIIKNFKMAATEHWIEHGSL